MVDKIKAALWARSTRDLIVIARTDARSVEGLNAAINRAKAYVEAGADAIFVEAPQSIGELARIGESFNVPLICNMIGGGKTPLLTVDDLAGLGFKIALFPVSTVYATAGALQRVLHTLYSRGTTRDCWDQMITFRDFNELVGLGEYERMERCLKDLLCGAR